MNFLCLRKHATKKFEALGEVRPRLRNIFVGGGWVSITIDYGGVKNARKLIT